MVKTGLGNGLFRIFDKKLCFLNKFGFSNAIGASLLPDWVYLYPRVRNSTTHLTLVMLLGVAASSSIGG